MLLPNCDSLLTHDELTQLAWRYESELKKATATDEENNRFSYHKITRLVALHSIAVALKDPGLYERATLISSPEPNDLQKQDVIKTYLRFNQPEDALRWLNTSWQSRFESVRLRLLDEAYQQSGNVDDLKKTRFNIYRHDQSYASFKQYLACLSEAEKQNARLEAIQLAQQGGSLAENINMLLSLEVPNRAQNLVLDNPQGIADCFYGELLELAKKLEAQKCWLAATACYRSLLWDILNQGRSKAYTHAARYYKKLEVILDKIHQFEPLQNHSEFLQQLKDKHGLKQSFWQRVV